MFLFSVGVDRDVDVFDDVPVEEDAISIDSSEDSDGDEVIGDELELYRLCSKDEVAFDDFCGSGVVSPGVFAEEAVGEEVIAEELVHVENIADIMVANGAAVADVVVNTVTTGIAGFPIVFDDMMLLLDHKDALHEMGHLFLTNNFLVGSTNDEVMAGQGCPHSRFVSVNMIQLVGELTSDDNKCKICHDDCGSPQAMYMHLVDEHLYFGCSLCGDKLPNYSELWRHVAVGECRAPDGMFDGDYAGSFWTNAAVADRCLAAGYISSDTRRLLYGCMEFCCSHTDCSSYFLDKRSHQRHILNVHMPLKMKLNCSL